MTLDDGTTCWTIHEDKLATVLSNCASFQNWCGAADAAEALAFITFDEFDEPTDGEAETEAERVAAPVRCFIASAPEEGFSITTDRTANGWQPQGVMTVTLQRYLTDEEYEIVRREVLRTERNLIGAIVIEAFEYSRSSSYLSPTAIRVEAGPSVNADEEQAVSGLIIETDLSFAWARA